MHRSAGKQDTPPPAETPVEALQARHAARLIEAAGHLAPAIRTGTTLTRALVRDAMGAAFGGNELEGQWMWRDAYEACEIAIVRFLVEWGPAMRARAGDSAAMLEMLERIAALELTQTRRSVEQLRRQHFSTPLALGWAVAEAARIEDGDTVLEPSAGTGNLAVLAYAAAPGARVHTNEIDAVRHTVLATVLAQASHSHATALTLAAWRPDLAGHTDVVMMNPPFSAQAGSGRRRLGEDLHHARAAFDMLRPGGRLVMITGANSGPHAPRWQRIMYSAEGPIRMAWTASMAARLYQRKGVGVRTRITVIDREHGAPGPAREEFHSARALLEAINADLGPRPARPKRTPPQLTSRSAPSRTRRHPQHPARRRHAHHLGQRRGRRATWSGARANPSSRSTTVPPARESAPRATPARSMPPGARTPYGSRAPSHTPRRWSSPVRWPRCHTRHRAWR